MSQTKGIYLPIWIDLVALQETKLCSPTSHLLRFIGGIKINEWIVGMTLSPSPLAKHSPTSSLAMFPSLFIARPLTNVLMGSTLKVCD